MIRTQKTVNASVLSPPSSGPSTASSPSSPVPPPAASSSFPHPSDADDYAHASAPPPFPFNPTYGPILGQNFPAPHEYQLGASDPYRLSQYQQPQLPSPQPTPYHNMPPLAAPPMHLHSHTPQQQQQQIMPPQYQPLPQQQQHPQTPPPQYQHQHQPQQPPPQYQPIQQQPPSQQQQQQQPPQQYQPIQQQPPPHQQHQPSQQYQSIQQQPPQHAQTPPAPHRVHAMSAPALSTHQPQHPQPQQQQKQGEGEEEQHQQAPKKVLPPLPPTRRHTEGLTEMHPQRVASDPALHGNERQEKPGERSSKSWRASTSPTSAVQQQLAGLALGKEKEPVAGDVTTGAAAVHDLYVDANQLTLNPEYGDGSGGDNYLDISGVHFHGEKPSVGRRESSHPNGGGDDEGHNLESNYVGNLAEEGASSPLPAGYAEAADVEAIDKAKKAIAKSKSHMPVVDASEVKARRKSVKLRGNRWEIEFEELEIDKRIGQGAYGSVYKGKWRNTVVAIKTIRENMASFHEAKFQEFHAEAEMMMDMRPHTHVVQLFGVCMHPYMAIVVEYLEGGSLQELLQSKADIDLHTGLKIALHAAAGVAHLHAEGICHRDLAARNLLLTSRNKDYMVVKVADFGLSRFTEDAEDNFTKCKVGPLKWMPPESLQEQKYSYKSDAWAMGVVMWEIFARQEPFPGVSPVQVAIGVSSRGMCLKPPSSCPPEIAQLMFDCWSYDPKDRPDFRTITRTIEQVIESNPQNYNIVANPDDQIMCTHPAPAKGSARPTPPPRQGPAH